MISAGTQMIRPMQEWALNAERMAGPNTLRNGDLADPILPTSILCRQDIGLNQPVAESVLPTMFIKFIAHASKFLTLTT